MTDIGEDLFPDLGPVEHSAATTVVLSTKVPGGILTVTFMPDPGPPLWN